MRLLKRTIIILLIISLCAGAYAVYAQANRIFPVDVDEVYGISVTNEQTKPITAPWTAYLLEGNNKSNRFAAGTGR